MCYINYYFENISYDENYYLGTFLCPDAKVRCDFIYNRITKEICRLRKYCQFLFSGLIKNSEKTEC